MPALKQTKPESSALENAMTEFNRIQEKREKLFQSLEGMKLARSFSVTSGKLSDVEDRVPDHLKEKAKPYFDMAVGRPNKLLESILDAEDSISKIAPEFIAAHENLEAEKRHETNRVAEQFQPKHRETVKRMVQALEDLSQAMADEKEVRAQFAKAAPLPTSSRLPDLSIEHFCGSITDWGSPAWEWARKIRKLEIVRK